MKSGGGMRVLVVDGHEVVRDGVALALGRHLKGCEIVGVSNCTDALDVIANSDIDLVITELSVSGRVGAELIQDVFSINRNLPVLVHTACEERDYGIRAIQSGALGYVTKDSGVDVLLQAVSQLLKGQHFVSVQVAQQLVSFVRQDSAGPPHELLSEREFQVLKRIGHGRQNKEIGAELNLSPKTVATYRTRVLAKLKLRTPADLVRYCIEHSL